MMRKMQFFFYKTTMPSWGKAKRKGSYRKGDPTKQNLKKLTGCCPKHLEMR